MLQRTAQDADCDSEQAPRAARLRGMYEISQLAWLFDNLTGAKTSAEYEKAFEGDPPGFQRHGRAVVDPGAELPAMLAELLTDLGAALIAMAQEEVGEATEGKIMTQATLPGLKRLIERAGKAVSKENAEHLDEAQGHHRRALMHHRAAVEHHRAMGEHSDAMAEECGAAAERCDEIGEGMRAASEMAMPAEVKDHLDRCMRAHAALQRGLETMAGHLTGAGDEHEGIAHAHLGIHRCIRSAERCVRSVTGAAPGNEPAPAVGGGDNQTIQTSAGTGESEGSTNGRGSDVTDYYRRQAEALALAVE